MTQVIEANFPMKFKELFDGPARYRCAYGGRGSGKTQSFATMLIIKAYELAYLQHKSGSILCAREIMRSLKDSSLSELKHAIERLGLDKYFIVGKQYIRTANNKINFIFAGLRHNMENIKSTSSVHICWIDEAEGISFESWALLIPTIRVENSEIWATWNPKYENTATDKLFIKGESNLSGLKIAKVNYVDNPWFPKVLDNARKDDIKSGRSDYGHIWLGEYITDVRGAYYLSELNRTKEDGRITYVPVDPIKPIYAFFDIGGTGHKSDATAIWMAQFIDKEIRLIDYYEVRSQPLSAHVNWLIKNGYENARIILPHDGVTHDRVHNVSFETEFIRAGFRVDIVKNQGAGAAMKRIESARKWFGRCWFDERRTAIGIKALEWYHEKWDERRNTGLGPDHDWSSHGADAFGMMAVYYKEPSSALMYNHFNQDNASWLGR